MPSNRDPKPYTHGRTDCCIVGCERDCTHGVCQYHRTLYGLRTGNRATPASRLAFLRARCHMVGHPDPCWIPDAASINDKGYVWVTFYGQRKVRGHRLAYQLQRLIDDGEWCDLAPTDYVLHSDLCERRFVSGLARNRCWNPAHLRIGDGAENGADMSRARRLYDPFVRAACATAGCGSIAHAKGYCRKCYRRWKRAQERDEIDAVQDTRL